MKHLTCRVFFIWRLMGIILSVCFLSYTIAAAPAPTVELLQVHASTQQHMLNAQGSVASPMMTTVSASVAGHVASLNVSNGQKVNQGDTLIILDHQAASDTFNQAKVQLDISQKALDRAEYLLKRHLLSQESFDLSKSQYSKDKAAFEQAQNQLADYTIQAPFSGVVGKAMLSVGDYVTPGQPLIPLVSLDRLTIDYSLSENELARVKVGDTVHFSTPIYPQKTFQATVSFIALSIDEKTRTFDVQANISPSDLHQLRPGMFVKVHDVIDQDSRQIQVPEQAIVIHQGRPTVFIFKDGHAIQKNVTLGERRLGMVVVLSGLQAQDQMIVSGQDTLHDHQKVAVNEVGK